ncbi:MAG: cyclic nucleotide-binding domain-containing protein [Chloroflexi bacterium]|nr:cyclic nucleotide-binding domain-containing protein [Chloroflexota bacterium]
MFRDLPPAALQQIVGEVRWLKCLDGEILARQGETADSMFIVDSGCLAVVAELPTGEMPLANLEAGQCVGEIGLLTGVRRTSTVRALGEVVVLKFSADAFHRLERTSAELAERVSRLAAARLRRNELVVALRRSEVFGQLEAEVRAEVELELESVFLSGGSTLFHEGDPGECLYLVARGRLRVERAAHEVETGYTAELGPGDCVGELALLANQPRTATVYTVRDTHLARLTRAAFERLLQKHPLLMTRALSRASVRRLVGSAAGRATAPAGGRTIAVLPVSPDVPLEAFCAALAGALANGGAGRALHVSSRRLDATLGQMGIAQVEEDNPSSARVQAWLAEQELTHALTLYEADPGPSAWTSHCVHQADYLLLVGRAEADPALGALEGWLERAREGRPSTGRSLVLIHTDTGVPDGTRRWLAPRQVEQHHHVRLSSSDDFGRLGRFLTGRAVGLVLGGGGARGFAHAGVIRALREAGTPIDAVGGTSVGAVFAAEYAMGWTYSRMVAETRSIATGIADPTFPIVSLIAGQRGGRVLAERLGDVHIEDMWLPFFCVSANLSRGAAVVHRAGPLAPAMMASNAAPGIYPPVVLDGDLLVDGALLDNLPVGAMSALLGGGSVIAVDVSPRVDLTSNSEYGLGLSGWRVLWSKLNPFKPGLRVPTILEILMRTTELGSIGQQEAAAAPLHPAPRVPTRAPRARSRKA